MDWSIFEYIGKSIETILDVFVSQTSSSLIGGLQSTVAVGVTLYFVIFGYMVMGGYIQNTMSELVKRGLTIAIILGIAFTASAYQSNVIEVFRGLETGLATLVYKGTASNIYEVLDKSFCKGMELANVAYGKAGECGWTELGECLAWIINGIIIALATEIITVICAAFIFLAKIAISILLGVGPIFIVCLIFPPTRRFFDAWLGQLVSYVLMIVFMAVVMSFAMGIFGNFVEKVDLKGESFSVIAPTFQLLTVSLVLVIIAWQVPSIASALGGGVGLSMSNPVAGTARSVARGARNIINPLKTRRDMSSGRMETRSRMGHIMAGNTMLKPAYRKQTFDNIKKAWKREGGEAKNNS